MGFLPHALLLAAVTQAVARPTTCPAPTRTARALYVSPGDLGPGVEFIPSGTVVSVLVGVRIAQSGRLLSAKLLSHDVPVNAATYALRVARESTYLPALKECKPVSSMLVLTIDYYPFW